MGLIRSGRQRRRRRERKQKPGCRAGLLAGLRKQLLKPPSLSLYLTNARSMIHKADDLKLHPAVNCYARECCVLIITETWLHTQIPDATVQLAGRTLQLWDRNSNSGKNRGGGPCIYVHEGWYNNSTVLDRHCSPDLVFMSLRCRPFFFTKRASCCCHYYSLHIMALSLEDALPRPQDCFEQTEWDAFYHEDLATFTDTVLSFCIRVLPNQKPWMTTRMLLWSRDSAFRTGNRALYSAARAYLKKNCQSRIQEEDRGTSGTDHHQLQRPCNDSDAALAEELNSILSLK